MPHPSIILLPDAEKDLQDLFDHIAADSGLQRAELILRRIEHTLGLLAEWPFIGRLRPDLGAEIRAFTVWPWLLFYAPQKSGSGIVVWRIVDGRRDLAEIVKPQTG